MTKPKTIEELFDFLQPKLAAIEAVCSDIKDAKIALAKLETKCAQLEAESKEIKSDFADLQTTVARLSQHNVNTNILIRGVPEKSGEKLPEAVATIIKFVDEKNKHKILSTHRVGKSVAGKTRAILVQLSSSHEKLQLLALKRKKNVKCSDISVQGKKLGDENDVVYFGEHLAPFNARIYYIARQLVKKKELHSCWVRNGIVSVRKAEGQEPLNVYHENQFAEVVVPSTTEDGTESIADKSIQILDECLKSAQKPRAKRAAARGNRRN